MSQIIWTATDGRRDHSASFWTATPEAFGLEGFNILGAIAACQTVSQTNYQSADIAGAVPQAIAGGANVLDCACLVFTGAGASVRLVILGADPSIYLSDGETVDLSNPNIVNLISTSVSNNLCTRGGRVVNDLERGYRIAVPASPIYRY